MFLVVFFVSLFLMEAKLITSLLIVEFIWCTFYSYLCLVAVWVNSSTLLFLSLLVLILSALEVSVGLLLYFFL